MRKLLLSVALATAAVSGCSKSEEAAAGKKAEDNLASMTVDQVEAAVTAKKAIAVDCNTDKTRQKMGIVPGAILVDDTETYPVSLLPAEKSTQLVFYCANPG